MKSSEERTSIDTGLSKQTIPKTWCDHLETETLSLYDRIYVYICFVIAIIIVGGGVAGCIVYYSKTPFPLVPIDIILTVGICLKTVIVMSVTIFKQTRHEPRRNQSSIDPVKTVHHSRNTQLKRAARRDWNALRRREVFLKKTKSYRLINYSLSNASQTDLSGSTTRNLIIKRVCIPTQTLLSEQRKTEIMIVRVPRVPGELVIHPKNY